MIVDLSHPLYSGMPVYPGDAETVILPQTAIDREGYLVHAISMNSHAGTHLDAPRHYFQGSTPVDSQQVLEACIGQARVIDVSPLEEGAEIMPRDLGIPPADISQGERILLATGWSGRFGTDSYFDRFPSISQELAALFVRSGIVLLGVETPSLHVTLSDDIHKTLLSAGIIVVENLTKLKDIAGKRVFFSAAPLKLSGLDGSPVRAYAIIDDP
jgi:arylformamidase